MSGEGKAVPSPALELRHCNISAILEAEPCSPAGMAALRLSCCQSRRLVPSGRRAAPLSLCGAGQSCCLRPRRPGAVSSACGRVLQQSRPAFLLHIRAPAPQQVPLFVRAWCVSDPMFHATKPFAPGHAEEIYPTTSNAK